MSNNRDNMITIYYVIIIIRCAVLAEMWKIVCRLIFDWIGYCWQNMVRYRYMLTHARYIVRMEGWVCQGLGVTVSLWMRGYRYYVQSV